MMQFTFKYLHERFDLCVQGKYTILLGDSGTGKSLLVQLAEKYANVPIYGECSAICGIDALTSGRWKSALRSSAEIVVVDEDVLLDDDSDDGVLSLMESTDKYFIIVCRSGVVDADIVFELETVSEHHRRMIPMR